MPDDIKPDRPPASSTEKTDPAKPAAAPPAQQRRVVGPESEVRGGAEAPDDAA